MCRRCIEQMVNLERILCHYFRSGVRYQDIRDMASANHWMDMSVRRLKILFSFYGLDLEEEVLEVTIAYGVRISGTTSIRPMHGLRCLLVKCCKKGLKVIREVIFPTGRIRMFLIWNKSVKSKKGSNPGGVSFVCVFSFEFHFSMNSEKTVNLLALLWKGLDSFMLYQSHSGRYHFKTHVWYMFNIFIHHYAKLVHRLYKIL